MRRAWGSWGRSLRRRDGVSAGTKGETRRKGYVHNLSGLSQVEGPCMDIQRPRGPQGTSSPHQGCAQACPALRAHTLPSGLSVGLPEARAPRSGPSTRLSLWWHSGTSLTIASSYEADSSNQQPPPNHIATLLGSHTAPLCLPLEPRSWITQLPTSKSWEGTTTSGDQPQSSWAPL